MNLVKQADDALTAIVNEVGGTLEGDARVLARLAWMDGFKAGVEATTAKMDESFAKWQAEQRSLETLVTWRAAR